MKLVINRRKIEELRIEKGLSLKGFREAAKVSDQTIRRIISGDSIPLPGTLKKIADVLDVKVMEIVSIEDGYNENRRHSGRKRKATINE